MVLTSGPLRAVCCSAGARFRPLAARQATFPRQATSRRTAVLTGLLIVSVWSWTGSHLPFAEPGPVRTLLAEDLPAAKDLPVNAQTPRVSPAAGSEDEVERVNRESAVEAPKWTFRLDAARDLSWKPQPLLRWSNPNVGRVFGNVYLWTDRGCPAVIGSMYRWYTPYQAFNIELKCLGRGKLVGQYGGETAWRPKTEDVEYRLCTGAATPAKTPTERLRQLRALASEFEGQLLDTRVKKIDGIPQQLRRLTQPIYRYDSQNPEIIDGAVFAFVHGTDPELILLLEARQDNTGTYWHYALARMNGDAIQAKRGGREIWSVPAIKVFNEPESAYVVLDRAALPKLDARPMPAQP